MCIRRLPGEQSLNRKKAAHGERVFSIELDSRENLRDVSVPGWSQKVIIEGTIGDLQLAEFVDDAVLQLTGSGGVLRIDLSRRDLRAKGAVLSG